MRNPKEIKRLVDTLFTKKGVYPEKYISNISNDNLNLPVLRAISNLVMGKSNPEYNRIIEEFPDLYKVSTEKLLGIEPTFNIPDLGKNLTIAQAKNKLGNRYDSDEILDNEILDEVFYVKQLVRDAQDSKRAIISIARALGNEDKKLVQANSKKVRKSMYDLFKEIAELRNPKGATVYRDPNYLSGNDITKASGIVSFTNNPIKLAKATDFNDVYKYKLEPSELVADFSNTTLGYPWESEVQALMDITKKPNKYMKDYFTRKTMEI